MPFGEVYPLYVNKAEKKDRTKREVDKILRWLTGYTQRQLMAHVRKGTDFETFFAAAPLLHPDRSLITGVVCGVRVEEVEELERQLYGETSTQLGKTFKVIGTIHLLNKNQTNPHVQTQDQSI